MNDTKHILVLSTCPEDSSAKKIAQHLVESKLAACVNVIPKVQSYFYWEKEVKNSNEHILIIKTTINVYDELESCIQSLHPYKLPEIVAIPFCGGSTNYLNWININTKK